MSKMQDTAAAGERLPDDLVLEVLARVPTNNVVALFRCAVACKRWCAFVVDLAFLRSRWPEKTCHPSALLGFFAQQQRCDADNGLFEPVFLPPSSGSALGSSRRSLASFIPGLPHGELDGAVPLTARHGLLLVRLARRANDDSARLAMCNLLAGTCVALPSLKPRVFSVNCAIVTSVDYHSSDMHHHGSPLSPNFFKVLAIVVDNSRNPSKEYNNLYTFSSAEPGWSEPTNCFGVAEPRNLAIVQLRNKVVVCGGMARWLVSSTSQYYMLDVNIETSDITLAKLIISKTLLSTRRYIGGPTLIVNAAGSPSLFWVQEEGNSLDMWTGPDIGDWFIARTVDLKPPKMWNPSEVHVWSGEKSGVLLITDAFQCVHMADVESRAVEDVSEQFRSSWGMMAVPMEIDWPTLFMSRLGGG